MLPGSAHQCSDRFKGGVQRKWADKEFGKETLKNWSLGIEANENKRHKRFTMNRGEQIPQHQFYYPFVELQNDSKHVRHAQTTQLGLGTAARLKNCQMVSWLQEWK